MTTYHADRFAKCERCNGNIAPGQLCEAVYGVPTAHAYDDQCRIAQAVAR